MLPKKMTIENWKDICGAIQIQLDNCKEKNLQPRAEDLAFIALEDDYDFSDIYPN